MKTFLNGAERAFPNVVERHFELLLFALTSCIAPLQGATLERLSLDDMIAKSTAIVRGTVTDAYAAYSGPVIYTHYRIQVTERYKGSPGAFMDVAVPGGVLNQSRQSFPGAPQLNPGDDFVFFLWTGRSGITQIIGLTQGLFAISGSSSNPIATRAASRELMLEHGTGHPVKDQTLVLNLSDLRARIASVVGGSVKP